MKHQRKTSEESKIPEHRQLKKLREVCTYSKGKMPHVLKEEKSKECSIPYINIKAFEKAIFAQYTNGVKCNLCNDGDLLMVWDGARCGLIGKAKKGAVGSTLMKILPTENIHKEYLYHFISSKFHTLNTKPKGVGIPHIEPTLLWNFELIVPPFPEQQAIVSKIEELLSDLENGKQQLQTAQQQLKVYRQSLLKAAFEGKLTNETVIDKVSLGSVIEQPKYGTSKKCDYKTKGIGVLRIPNVGSGFIDATDLKFADFDQEEIATYSLKDGDLLTIRSNGSVELVGKCALITEREKDYLFAGYLIRLRPLIEKINPSFLLYALSSHDLRIQIESKAKSTSGVNNINSEEIKSLEIPLLPIKRQQLIVDELESKLTVCDKIEETISQSLQQAETLRQSILKKAFEGKLTWSIKE